jgi:hypothetical protein
MAGCIASLLAWTDYADAQKYYAREKLQIEKTAPATPPGPVAKNSCSSPSQNTILSSTIGSSLVGYATTPYTANGAWQAPAMALCKSFSYGPIGKCYAMWLTGGTIVSVYGYSNTGTSVEAKPSHVAESISTICTAL